MRPTSVKVRVEVEFVPKNVECGCDWACHTSEWRCSFCFPHHEAWQAVQPVSRPGGDAA